MDRISRSTVDNSEQTSQSAYNALVSEVTAYDVAKSAKMYFSKVDTNDDGTLSEVEIKAVARDDSINAKDKRLIGTLAGRVASVEKMSSGTFFADKHGITYEDLNVLGRLASEQHARPRSQSAKPTTSSDAINEIDAALATRSIKHSEVFGAVMKQSFSAMDADKNYSVSRLELKDFLQSSTASDDQKEVARVMMAHFDDFKNLSTYGIDGVNSGDNYGDVISSRDVRTFSEYMTNPAKFESQLKSFRRYEIADAMLGTPVCAVSAVFMGGMAIADPEPITKILCGGAAILTGAGFVAELHKGFIGFTGEYRKDFESRQRMLNSWKYFQ